MNHLYFYILLVLNFQTISGQACNSSSDTTQCSVGEICRNNLCEPALHCGGDNNLCQETPEPICVSDYCQPTDCASNGQCVHGQVCSQDTTRRCVYTVVANIEESSEYTFAFKEPATPGSYQEIMWLKSGRDSLNRLAGIHPIITLNKTQYWKEFCSGNNPCRTSDRAHLNTDTGDLTIHSVQISNEGFYYYDVYSADGKPDTGLKYEYQLNVYVTGTLTIQGVPSSDHVEVGTNLTLACNIDKFRPKPLGVYWVINGRNITGNITSEDEDGDGVFNLTSNYTHSVTKEDEKIVCVVVLVYGNPMFTDTVINPGYGPSSRPSIQASPGDIHIGEKVTLTCQNPIEDGNPSCDKYTWNGKGVDVDNQEKTYEFTVNETFTKYDSIYGNFTCVCKNQFGSSLESDIFAVMILEGHRKSPSTGGGGGGNVALIGGAIGGILFIVLIIIIVVFITRRKNKPKAAPDCEPKQLVQNGVHQEPVYAQPNKSRKLRPQRGLDEGPQYANTGQLQGENPYENTGVDNNNPPTKQNGIMPPELIYIEVDVGKKDAKANGNKPVPKERSSMRKTKINRSDDPTMYAEIQPKA